MAKVVIYTSPTCPWCIKTKAFFKEQNIKYSEKNIVESEAIAQEAIKKSGQIGVPVILVDDEVIVGFDQPALKKALKIK